MLFRSTMKEAHKTAWAPQWIEAWNKEILGLEERGVWEVVPITAACLPLISSKLVFNVKRDEDGYLDKFKIRAVARGFSQVDGMNYDSSKTYSPVVTLVTVRMLLCIFAAIRSVTIWHFDVSQAFLWAPLSEVIYLQPFDGMNVPPNHCLRLLKAIYGLKQSSYEWYKTFKKALLELFYKPSDYDECVFTFHSGGSFIIVCIFVDDMLVFTNDTALKDKLLDRKSTRLNSSHSQQSRMPSSA